MTRQHSDIERSNLRWFQNDHSVASLRKIQIRKGEVRGLKKTNIDLDYPITAVCGKNGCGKSTVIALAACAFHNLRNGWKLPDRATTYYTFSDFFIQSSGEKPLDGVEIWYAIQHDGWQPSSRFPEGKGLGWQVSQKRKGGRWSDYDDRVDRAVAFLGVERVVPSVEKSVFRSYRSRFSAGERTGFEEAVCRSVSKVLGIPYDSFEFREHGKYRLPWVQRKKGAGYSGFNMGAGEKALFEFFATVLSAPKGALFLVDEIELGLHEQAQGMLIRVLSQLCNERRIQVICTTHSPVILSNLPPEGRLYVEPAASGVSVIPGISPEFATGKMSGRNSRELTIYVEDAVAETLVGACLDCELRSRVHVCAIGSHAAVLSTMAANMRIPYIGPALAILDGDQEAARKSHAKRFSNLTESRDGAHAWIEERLFFLPGGSSPEVFVLSQLRELDSSILCAAFQTPEELVIDAIDAALLAGDHAEIATFASAIHQEPKQAWRDCCRLLVQNQQEAFSSLLVSIRSALEANGSSD